MRMFKRLISCVLIVTLICSAYSIAFAANSTSLSSFRFSEDNVAEFVFDSDGSDGITLRTTDLENGDALFELVQGSTVVATSYLDRDALVITSTDCYGVEEVSNISESYVEIGGNNFIPNNPYSINGYITAGTIYYLLQGGREGVNYEIDSELIAEYTEKKSDVQYDLNGEYRDLATLTAAIAGICAFPAAIAGSVAGKVITALGLGAGFLNAVIPSYEVDAVRTRVTWRGQGLSATLMGERYDITHDDGTKQIEYDGSFYPVSSFASRNEEFALALADVYFSSFNNIIVTGWN